MMEGQFYIPARSRPSPGLWFAHQNRYRPIKRPQIGSKPPVLDQLKLFRRQCIDPGRNGPVIRIFLNRLRRNLSQREVKWGVCVGGFTVFLTVMADIRFRALSAREEYPVTNAADFAGHQHPDG